MAINSLAHTSTDDHRNTDGFPMRPQQSCSEGRGCGSVQILGTVLRSGNREFILQFQVFLIIFP